jgi:DUF1680 family protein
MVARRYRLNRSYMVSLKSENLLQNHYLEAGLWATQGQPEGIHWGWEAPTCQLRGHFLGHWLSAAANIYAHTGDQEIKGKADRIVSELGRCQAENGGEWAGSIPPGYLDWLAKGKEVWAPHYTLHKTLMGLLDMTVLADSEQALEIARRWANWFTRWTKGFTTEQMDDMLDVETGGMMEAWADLYALTGQPEHLELMRKYERRRFFDRLLNEPDALTYQHANTRIPEVHGAARAWEVTGERRYREVVEAFWRSAVTDRGLFCTGGQTECELWTPPMKLASHLGLKNQEHCTVYNMMRLAEYLLRWTGDKSYADYWERNLYNGVMAQQNSSTGMVAYFLPLRAGSVKKWATPTDSFWCCQATLVQAQTLYPGGIFYEDEGGLVICQYIPSRLDWQRNGEKASVTMKMAGSPQQQPQMDRLEINFQVSCSQPAEFPIKVRLPWWLQGQAVVRVNGDVQPLNPSPDGYACISKIWGEDAVDVLLPKGLQAVPLPDAPDIVAFLDGPVVMAGLCEGETVLQADPQQPETALMPVYELEWYRWRPGYRTQVEPHGIRFRPLYEIQDERYTVYFPIRQKGRSAQ